MEENKNKCHAEHMDYCWFIGKPCKDVDPEICKALGEAYDQGYSDAYG